MATQVEDTLEPSGTSGSGLYGVDTASAKEDKASESLICDDDKEILRLSIQEASESFIYDKDEEILRLSIQGFNFKGLRHNGWEKILVLRAGHRKVAIQLLDIKENPPDRKKGRSYVVQSSFHDFSTNYIGLWLILTALYWSRYIYIPITQICGAFFEDMKMQDLAD